MSFATKPITTTSPMRSVRSDALAFTAAAAAAHPVLVEVAEIEAQRSTLGAAFSAVRKAPLDAGGRRSSFWATRSRSSGWAESSGFGAGWHREARLATLET